jgi:glutathione S-transferase
MKMKLYEFGPTRSIRARWILQELGVDFESVRVNLIAGEHQRPEFLRINPAGKIPVLVDGDLVLTESVAIVLYLAEKYPESNLLPADLRQRAEVNRWLLFTVTELEQPLWRIARHTTLYPEAERLAGDVALASREFKERARVRRRRSRHGCGFCSGVHPRLGQRRSTARRLPAAARLHGADVRPAECAAAHRRSVRGNLVGTEFSEL